MSLPPTHPPAWKAHIQKTEKAKASRETFLKEGRAAAVFFLQTRDTHTHNKVDIDIPAVNYSQNSLFRL